MRPHPIGFTLVELLVVVAIIVLLVAMLVPSMESAVELSRRAKCAGNLHAVGIGSLTYTQQNKGVFIIGRNRMVLPYFTAPEGQVNGESRPDDRIVDWIAALASVGLFLPTKQLMTGIDGSTRTDYPPAPIWSCPSVTLGAQFWSATYNGQPDPTFYINYQYLGGYEKWRNLWFSGDSRSPVDVQHSSGGWVLAADHCAILGSGVNDWYGAYNNSFGWPNHKASPKRWPAGGNQLTVDGGVEWVPFDQMTIVTSWSPTIRIFFMKQTDLGDYHPPAAAQAEAWMK